MVRMRITTTPHAVRVMGVWLSRADAGLVRSAAANAAVAVVDEQRRRREWTAEEPFVLSPAAAPGYPVDNVATS